MRRFLDRILLEEGRTRRTYRRLVPLRIRSVLPSFDSATSKSSRTIPTCAFVILDGRADPRPSTSNLVLPIERRDILVPYHDHVEVGTDGRTAREVGIRGCTNEFGTRSRFLASHGETDAWDVDGGRGREVGNCLAKRWGDGRFPVRRKVRIHVVWILVSSSLPSFFIETGASKTPRTSEDAEEEHVPPGTVASRRTRLLSDRLPFRAFRKASRRIRKWISEEEESVAIGRVDEKAFPFRSRTILPSRILEPSHRRDGRSARFRTRGVRS